MLIDVLVLAVLLSVGFLSTRLATALRCPHSVFLVLLGIVGGALLRGQAPFPIDLRSDFAGIVLYIFLPPLIFESAFHLDFGQLRRDLGAVVALATFGLVLSALLVGAGFCWTLGIPLVAALLFGALISATDPVAVVALFHEMGAPRRLSTLVEGESLMNDATAIVLFRVLLALLTKAPPPGGMAVTVVLNFVLVTTGGVLVGLLFIRLAHWAFQLTSASAPAQIGLTVVTAYSSYLVADALHASGVMATLTVGLYLGNRARLELNREALNSLQALWEFIALAANTLVFLAVGFLVRLDDLAQAAPLLPASLVIVYLARAMSVGGTLGVLNATRRLPRIGAPYQAVLIWGGLRGGLSLALVLVLPPDFPLRAEFLAVTTAVVLATLLVNAATTRPLMRALQFDQLSQAERILYRRSVRHVVQRVFASLSEAADRGSLSAELVDELLRRSLQSLDVTGDIMPPEEALLFDVHQALLEEQQYYNEQIELGILSRAAYELLSRSVTQRVELMREGGMAALATFRFEVEMRERWFQHMIGPRETMAALSTALETLLHIEHAQRRMLETPIVEDVLRHQIEQWLAQCEHKLAEFHGRHPQLEIGVQSEFIAHTVAASANSALATLHRADVISSAVYALAQASVTRMHGDLLRDARRRFAPTIRELLSHHGDFAAMPEDALRMLEARSSRVRLAAGTELSRGDGSIAAVHLICGGTLEWRDGGGATPPITLQTGSLFAIVVPSIHVTALTDSELIQIPREVLNEILKAWPQVRNEINDNLLETDRPFLDSSSSAP